MSPLRSLRQYNLVPPLPPCVQVQSQATAEHPPSSPWGFSGAATQVRSLVSEVRAPSARLTAACLLVPDQPPRVPPAYILPRLPLLCSDLNEKSPFSPNEGNWLLHRRVVIAVHFSGSPGLSSTDAPPLMCFVVLNIFFYKKDQVLPDTRLPSPASSQPCLEPRALPADSPARAS